METSSSSSLSCPCSSASSCCSMEDFLNPLPGELLSTLRRLCLKDEEDQKGENTATQPQNPRSLSRLEQTAPEITSNIIRPPPGFSNADRSSNRCNYFTSNPVVKIQFGPSSSVDYPSLNLTVPNCQDSPFRYGPEEFGWDYSEVIQDLQQCNMVEMAKTQAGSQRLQVLLWKKQTLITDIIFGGILDDTAELAVHQYGCHVFTKLTEACDVSQLERIVWKLTVPFSIIIKISINLTGSKTIQKLIQFLRRSPLVNPIVSALAYGFHPLMTDQNGNFVINKCITLLRPEQNKELYEQAIRCCIALAVHQKGCVSLNNLIHASRGPYRDRLLYEITQKTVFLSQDPTGNYVVQNILSLQHPYFTRNICCLLQGHYERLSCQKSASHVVEKCLQSSEKCYALHDLVTSKNLLRVACDQFGNYVIQTALRVTEAASVKLHEILLKALNPHLESLAYHPHGNNVHRLIKNGVPI